MVKKIIFFILLLTLSGCQQTRLSDTNVTLKVLEGENIGDYAQSEIVLLYEVKNFLYNNFKITYDEMNHIHDEYFYIGPSFNEKFNKYYMNLDATGLSIKDLRDQIKEKHPYNLEHIDEDNEAIGDNKYLMSITEVIPGLDEDKTIVYVKLEIDSSLYNFTEYRLYKYIFKDVDGQYKIFVHQPRGLIYDGFNQDRLSKEELERELDKLEQIYNFDGNIRFKYEFDLRKFCEENLY